MALSHGLSLWLYPFAVQSSPPMSRRDYRSVVTGLEFTTASPGGFGTLSATLNLNAKHLSRPELQLFARVELVGKGEVAFLGEISEVTLSGQDGVESVNITALGVGNCLRDDAANFSYSAKTAQFIAADQFTTGAGVRTAYNFPVSFDTTRLFPDNPGTTYSPSYAWRTMEEIIGDVCTLAGGYVWHVWDHPVSRDSQGNRQGRIEAITKDITTTHYIASIQAREVQNYSITQTAERAYNRVEIGYNEPSSGAPNYVSATDSRLAGSGAINSAPFRRRKLVRDFAGNSAATSANAQIVANTLLAQYKNGGSKVSITLGYVRDSNKSSIGLYQVRAGQNIYLPDLAGRGNSAPLGAQPGVNQFFILQTVYRESQGQAATLELVCDNYTNNIDILTARLQYMAERQARTGSRTTETLQAIGATLKGWANGSFVAAAGGAVFALQGTSFRPILYQAPSSISWAAATYQVNNAGSPGVNNITQYGFNAFVTSTAGGATSYGGNFTTVGNCIYDLDEVAGTFTHHHGACGLRREGLSIERDIHVRYDGGAPAMQIECPCGGGEAYNLNLGLLRERAGPQVDEGREYHNSDHDAEQARNIRALMRHPSVALHHHVRDCDCAGCSKNETKRAVRTARKPRAARPQVTSSAAAPADQSVDQGAPRSRKRRSARTPATKAAGTPAQAPA